VPDHVTKPVDNNVPNGPPFQKTLEGGQLLALRFPTLARLTNQSLSLIMQEFSQRRGSSALFQHFFVSI